MSFVDLTIGTATLALIARHRFQTAPHGRERLRAGDRLRIDPLAEIEPYAHCFAGHVLPLRIGAFSYSYSNLDTAMSIGRYSSISWDVEVMGSQHPTEWATTSPFAWMPRPLGGIRAYLGDVDGSLRVRPFAQGPQEVAIGNDVWIGAGAMLKRGIRIGDGAVIAARSLVTKDVAPYAIVAGQPARLLRMRFPDALIARFADARWWRFGVDVLQPFDVSEPSLFLDRLEAAIDAGTVSPLALPVLTGADIIASGEAPAA